MLRRNVSRMKEEVKQAQAMVPICQPLHEVSRSRSALLRISKPVIKASPTRDREPLVTTRVVTNGLLGNRYL
jgi:hypothetical protein